MAENITYPHTRVVNILYAYPEIVSTVHKVNRKTLENTPQNHHWIYPKDPMSYHHVARMHADDQYDRRWTVFKLNELLLLKLEMSFSTNYTHLKMAFMESRSVITQFLFDNFYRNLTW